MEIKKCPLHNFCAITCSKKYNLLFLKFNFMLIAKAYKTFSGICVTYSSIMSHGVGAEKIFNLLGLSH